ncbi:MAG: efflux RND transporter periplasmic adaptor subunit [Beijerinckiaceae bacterium]|nr:efflux RND transporter periplasmic adaptor subunit [Beijerinckiaceae bacterium]
MKRVLALLILFAAAGGIYYYTQVYLPANAPAAQNAGQGSRRGGGAGRGGEGPVAVIVASVKRADVPVTIDAIGTVQALNTVTVKAQVDGKLIRIAFKDGQDVKAGDVLAVIDPTTYQAAYDQAVAKKAQDEAQLANARTDLERYERLAKTEYGSRQQADTQRATVAQFEAQVRSDQAAIDNAKAILDYTTVRAPIDGRTGIRAVDQGNIIKASDTTGLVVITQLKPISVLFNLPQQQLRVVSDAMAAGAVQVQAFESDGVTMLDTGAVTVVDNQVDQTTGTVRFKSNFPNDRLQLWPGQFVNVKVLVKTLRDAVVVPTSAVQRGPSGPFVYVVGDDNKVTLRTVMVGQQSETQSVINSGIAPPQRVVTTGFTRLTDGAAVTVTEAADEAGNPPAPANRDQVRQRRVRDPNAPEGQRGQRRQGERRNGNPPDQPGSDTAPNPQNTAPPPAPASGVTQGTQK